jgi:hypothetical protein
MFGERIKLWKLAEFMATRFALFVGSSKWMKISGELCKVTSYSTLVSCSRLLISD